MGDLNSKKSARIFYFSFLGDGVLEVQAGLEFRKFLPLVTLVLGQGVCATIVHLARIPFYFSF